MKTKLITALRIAANALEQNTFHYDWCHMERCNCGVVVCAMMGKSAVELDKQLSLIKPHKSMTWEDLAGEMCPVTGIPNDEIFGELHKHGMTALDIVELENLSNFEVLAKCNFGTTSKTEIEGRLWWKRKKSITTPVEKSYEEKQHVIIYLRAWADLLTEKHKEDRLEGVPVNAIN